MLWGGYQIREHRDDARNDARNNDAQQQEKSCRKKSKSGCLARKLEDQECLIRHPTRRRTQRLHSARYEHAKSAAVKPNSILKTRRSRRKQKYNFVRIKLITIESNEFH